MAFGELALGVLEHNVRWKVVAMLVELNARARLARQHLAQRALAHL